MDISKIQAVHLLNEMSDRREAASPASNRAAIASCGSGGNLPPGLPARAPGLDVGTDVPLLIQGNQGRRGTLPQSAGSQSEAGSSGSELRG